MPDVIFSRTILPFIAQEINSSYDPLSSSQTKTLIENLKDLLFLPLFRNKTEINLKIYQNILDKFSDCIESDLFIPSHDAMIKHDKEFFNRQIWKNVKAVDNFMRFTGLLSEQAIKSVLLNNVISRNLSMAMSLNQDVRLRAEFWKDFFFGLLGGFRRASWGGLLVGFLLSFKTFPS